MTIINTVQFRWENLCFLHRQCIAALTVCLFVNIEILSEKPGFEFCINAKHIMHHQHLAVAMTTGTNTNGGNMQTFRNFFCQRGRNFFQHNSKTTGFFQQ